MNGLLSRYCIWLLYLAVIIVSGVYHEPWRDEVDTWIMARYASWHEFITYCSYTGHPPLWPILHLPFARMLELPIETQKIFPVILAGAFAWILLFKFRIPLWFATALLFSVHLIYQHGVFARGYILMLLLMALTVTRHHERFEKPISYGVWIALLYQTEVFAWAFAGSLTFFYLWEVIQKKKPKSYLSLGLQISSAIIAVLLLWPRADANPARTRYFFDLESYEIATKNGFFPIHSYDAQIEKLFPPMPVLNEEIISLLFVWFGILIFVALLFMLQRSRMFIAAALCGAWFFVIFTILYRGSFWHHSLIPLFWVLILLLAQTDGAKIKDRLVPWFYRVLFIPMAVSCVVGVAAVRFDIFESLSGGKAAAGYIKQNAAEKNPLIISVGCDHEKSIAAYLPESRFWMEGYGGFSHHHLWNKKYHECWLQERQAAAQNALIRFMKEGEIWVVSSEPLENPQSLSLSEKLYSPGLTESFWVYSN